MALFYITGPTGSGKSTICKELEKLGYETYDTDNKGLRYWISNKTGQPIDVYRRNKRDDKWRADHFVGLSLDWINQVRPRASEKDVFICGTNANDLDFAKEFTKIILLSINEDEQTNRINKRSKNEYGADPKEVANAIKWRQAQIDKYKQAGAYEIDGKLPVSEIIDKILVLTRLA